MSFNTKIICLNVENSPFACLLTLPPPCQISAAPGCATCVNGQKIGHVNILVKYIPPRAFQDTPFSTVVVREVLPQRITHLGAVTERNICKQDQVPHHFYDFYDTTKTKILSGYSYPC